MFEAFVITLREGVEAALVVCLLLAYLSKTNRPTLRPSVLWGTSTAIAGSIAIAILLRFLDVDPENEAVEGTLLLISAVFVASLVAWMAVHGKALKRNLESKVDAISARPPGKAQKAALFLFSFLMVGREGVETVLFLAASSLSSDAVWTMVGGLAGIAIAAGLGISFLRGTLRIDLRPFFAITTIMLLVFALQLLAGAFHEFIEARVIRPENPARYMAVVGPLVRHSALFILAMLLLPFALVAWKSLRPAGAPAADPANPAEKRKLHALTRTDRAWRLAFSGLAIAAILAVGADHLYASREMHLSPATILTPRDGVVRIPLPELNDRVLSRFGVPADDRLIRFIVLPIDRELRVAFDACIICLDKGYVQQGEHVMCLNCTAEIRPVTIGSEGGCNPVPLPFTTAENALVVRMADLEAKRDLFTPAPDRECPYCRMRFKAVTPEVTTCPMIECRRRTPGGSP